MNTYFLHIFALFSFNLVDLYDFSSVLVGLGAFRYTWCNSKDRRDLNLPETEKSEKSHQFWYAKVIRSVIFVTTALEVDKSSNLKIAIPWDRNDA